LADFCDAFKNVSGGNPRQFDFRFVLFVNGLDFNFPGIRQKRTDDEAGFVAQRVHSEKRVRRLVFQFDNAS